MDIPDYIVDEAALEAPKLKPYEAPTNVGERIAVAIEAWKAEHEGKLPDIMYLCMRDAFALDRQEHAIMFRYMGVQVSMHDRTGGIVLGRIYS